MLTSNNMSEKTQTDKFGHGIAKFLGMEKYSAEEEEKQAQKWRRRSLALHGVSPGAEESQSAVASSPNLEEDALPSDAYEQEKQRVEKEVNELGMRGGIGFVAKAMNRQYRRSRINTRIKLKLADIHLCRPYFTIWVTSVQIVTYIVVVAVYGIAPIAHQRVARHRIVLRSNMAYDNVRHLDEANIWIGPRPRDLVHVGAKFAPCMHKDDKIRELIKQDRRVERGSACCIYYDKSGCMQTTSQDPNVCSYLLAKWKKNSDRGGTVCGLDPEYCRKPSALTGFWDTNDITKWPICQELLNIPHDESTDHMTCESRGKPCCIGLSGECIITTAAYCKFLNGYYFPDAFLCSQVPCLTTICGMVPFAKPDVPDQFQRLFTMQVLHGGLIDLVVSILFQLVIMRDLERLIGWLRLAIIYVFSGLVGGLASAIFLPYDVQAGPSGSQFGILACLFVEVIHNWYVIRRPWLQIFKLSVILFALFVIGLLPIIDNYAHLFGFLYGFLLAYPLMPFLGYRVDDRRLRIMGIVTCSVLAVAVLIMLLLLFYVMPIRTCSMCKYFNCVPFTPDFCQSSEMQPHRVCNFSDVSCV